MNETSNVKIFTINELCNIPYAIVYLKHLTAGKDVYSSEPYKHPSNGMGNTAVVFQLASNTKELSSRLVEGELSFMYNGKCIDIYSIEEVPFGLTSKWKYVHQIKGKVRGVHIQSNNYFLEDVSAFITKFRLPSLKLGSKELLERLVLQLEEYSELQDAVIKEDIVAIADGLIDSIYMALGTAVALGLPVKELWGAVHEANMNKERGSTKRLISVDLKKPEGWQAPDIQGILNRYSS